MVNDLTPTEAAPEQDMEPAALTETEEVQRSDAEVVEHTDKVLTEAFEARDRAVVEAIDHDVIVDGFADSGLWDDHGVETFVEENIPPEHLTNLNGITYMEDPEAESQGIMAQWVGTWGGDNYIFAFSHDDPDQLRETITHEIGHNAQDATIGWDTELAQEWENLHQQSDERISWYAATDPAEDFAECYSAYINDPELLQKISPAKYDFLKEHVFSDREDWEQ